MQTILIKKDYHFNKKMALVCDQTQHKGITVHFLIRLDKEKMHLISVSEKTPVTLALFTSIIKRVFSTPQMQ
jgi:hypothetical protein